MENLIKMPVKTVILKQAFYKPCFDKFWLNKEENISYLQFVQPLLLLILNYIIFI